MLKDVRCRSGLIGPNAILQLLPVLERVGGAAFRDRLLSEAGVFDVPDGSGMIPEDLARRVHHQLRVDEPEMAPSLSWEAGIGTADYILAHRIPAFASRILKGLPAPVAARLLSRAISQHAWTFAGSGRFRVVSPWEFELVDNPVIRGETSDRPLCHWHAAVFETLFQRLAHRRTVCTETACQAHGAPACRFELHIGIE